MTIGDRHLRFPGTINFHDMGGYETHDGGRVRSDFLYRSGHLAFAEANAKNDIAALDIRLICDFRTDEERQDSPTTYADGHTPKVVSLPIWPVRTPGVDTTVARLLRGDATIKNALEDQADGYREFVRDQSAQFANMFQAILGNVGGAVLLHCSGGKDRTGIASALLLTALGVPLDDVIKDYLLSADGNGAIEHTQFYVDQYWAAHISYEGAAPNCTEEDVRRLFTVQVEEIAAALDEIKDITGSADKYLNKTLGLTNESRDALKHRFVEQA